MSEAETFLTQAVREFKRLKRHADRALAQLEDRQFLERLDRDANSIAVLIKHLSGNFISRWTDFLTTDGEKPDRHRDGEFMEEQVSRGELLRQWERGWERLFSTVEALTPQDLERTVTIRSVPHSVIEAMIRGLTHTAEHVGQIILLAKHLKGAEWQTLSISRGQSEQVTAAIRAKQASKIE